MNFNIKAVSERIMLVVIDTYNDGAGVPDPSLDEIAMADAKANGSLSAAADVRRVEATVRADLATLLNAVGHQRYFVIPLNHRYYSEYRGRIAVSSVDEARRCIAGRGRGSSTEGFAFIADPDNPLLKAYLETIAASANGKVAALVDRIDNSIEAGRLTDGALGTDLLPALRSTRKRSSRGAKELTAQRP